MAGPAAAPGPCSSFNTSMEPLCLPAIIGGGRRLVWFGCFALLCSALSWPGWPLAHLELEDEREMGARFLGFLLARFGEWGRRGVMSLSG